MKDFFSFFSILAVLASCSLYDEPGRVTLRITSPISHSRFMEGVGIKLMSDPPTKLSQWTINGKVILPSHPLPLRLPPGEYKVTCSLGDQTASSEFSILPTPPTENLSYLFLVPNEGNVYLPSGTYQSFFFSTDPYPINNVTATFQDPSTKFQASTRRPKIQLSSTSKRSLTPKSDPPLIKDIRLPSIHSPDEFTLIKAHRKNYSPNFVFWFEGEISDSQTDVLNNLAEDLEKIILPRLEDLWGPSPDLDEDGRISFLFSKTINQTGKVIGFFNPSDLFQTNDDNDSPWFNPVSNYSEILYLGVPDTQDDNFSKESLRATMSHEISHLIYFYEKTVKPLKLGHLNSVEEEIFLSEGLAHLTEILCGFSTTGGTIYFAKDFLKDPGRYSLTAQDADGNIDSVGKRGGITLFLNWMFWQRGGAHWNTDSTKIEDKGGISFLRALMSSQRVGTDNLSSAFGRELSLVFPEWVRELSLQKVRCLKDENQIFDPISQEILTLGAYSGEVSTSDSTKVLLNGPIIQTPLNSSPAILPYSFFWSDNITVTWDHIIKFHTTSAGSQFGVILNRIQL